MSLRPDEQAYYRPFGTQENPDQYGPYGRTPKLSTKTVENPVKNATIDRRNVKHHLQE